MGSSTLFKSLPKFGHFGAPAIARRSPTSNTSLLFASNPKSIHTNPPQDGLEAKDAIKPEANEGMTPGEHMMQDKAYSTAEHVSEKTRDMAGMLSARAQEVSAKAKEAMEAAKDSAHRAKDTVVETTKDSKQFVKANAKTVEKCMNTKNRS